MSWTTNSCRRCLVALTALACALLAAGSAEAQKTDVIVLVNGDQVTAEIKELSRGRLRATTDGMGTVYIEWDDIVQLSSPARFEVELRSGDKFTGSLLTAEEPGTARCRRRAAGHARPRAGRLHQTGQPRLLVSVGRVDRRRLQLREGGRDDPVDAVELVHATGRAARDAVYRRLVLLGKGGGRGHEPSFGKPQCGPPLRAPVGAPGAGRFRTQRRAAAGAPVAGRWRVSAPVLADQQRALQRVSRSRRQPRGVSRRHARSEQSRGGLRGAARVVHVRLPEDRRDQHLRRLS